MGGGVSRAAIAEDMVQSVVQEIKRPEKAAERVRTLLAWGSNKSQQCGAPTKGMVLHPRELKQFHGLEIEALAAGHRHSCAVLSNGDVQSWGKNLSGQLGIGYGGQDRLAESITAFQGHPRIKFSSLGHDHSLFVDISGALWAAGENSRGQLGLGTAIQGPWPGIDQPMPPLPAFLIKSELNQRMNAMGIDSSTPGGAVSPYLIAPVPLLIKKEEMRLADSFGPSVLHSPSYTPDDHRNEGTANRVAAAALGFGDPADLLAAQGILYGQHHTPVRTGHSLHPLLAMYGPRHEIRALQNVGMITGGPFSHSKGDTAEGKDSATPQAFAAWLETMSQPGGVDTSDAEVYDKSKESMTVDECMEAYSQGLHQEHVIKVAASHMFSAAVTGSGEVWTFGYSSCGKTLGSGNILQTEARRVGPRLAKLIAANGGGVDVAAGSDFITVLARNGAVIMWGKHAPDGVVVTASGGLPTMIHIAAGCDHALMSDGETVWSCQKSSQVTEGWTRPRVVESKGLKGVSQLSAGGHASAVIDSESKLWMWGRLAEAGSPKDPPVQLSCGRPVMPCLNSFEKQPVKIDAIGGPVTHVALGSNHVLAAVAEH